MFGIRRRQIQKRLPPITAQTEYDLACALLGAFRGNTGTQQLCFYCDARGGFEISHHKNCIIDAAARRLFTLGVYDQRLRRYLKFDEHNGEVKLLRAQLQKRCEHLGREHRVGSWWCPDCHASELVAISDSTK